MPRQPLGRGLSALLGEDTLTATAVTGTAEIDIDLIEPNPQQPRTRFAEQNLDELTQSIKANGIVQPIVVRARGGRYEIVAGERRWRAAQRAELRKIPAVVRDIPDEKLLELALIENIQRQELNPIEEAKAYRKLIDSIGLTQEIVAERVGRERSLITTTIRLLKLPQDIQQHIEEGRLSMSHGRALLMTDDTELQRATAKAIINRGLSVRETENAIKNPGRKRWQSIINKQVTSTTDPNVKAAETKLMRRLGTNVKILPAKKAGGKIEIEYYGMDDLDRIYRIIIGNQEERQ